MLYMMPAGLEGIDARVVNAGKVGEIVSWHSVQRLRNSRYESIVVTSKRKQMATAYNPSILLPCSSSSNFSHIPTINPRPTTTIVKMERYQNTATTSNTLYVFSAWLDHFLKGFSAEYTAYGLGLKLLWHIC